MKSRSFRTIVAIPVLGSLGFAQPITKTGNCPTFTRSPAGAGDNWGQFPIKPNPVSEFPVGTVQDPLTPAQSANCLQVPTGMKAELWAAETMSGSLNPGLHYLQSFTFDERGRLWAVEPRSYPNIIRTASGSVTDQKFQGGQDRILILEDTNGDKIMDNVKVFKSGLNMPQSIEIVKGGVVVTMTPYIVYFPNNNDVAGTPVILFSGMGGGNGNYDSHGTISSIMYGLDNWMYGHTGYNTCTVNGQNCGGGRTWRFRHTALGHATTTFEVWTTGLANAWGIGQMEDGQLFTSNATGTPHINHAIRKGVGAIDIRYNPSGGANLFYPITGDRFLWEGSTGKSGNVFTSSTTAVSGMQIYTSRLFPKKYWNRFAFACEGANKLCNQDSLVPHGSTWRAHRLPLTAGKEPNLIASTDAWVAPVLAKTGPDGAVWVMDWYNYLFLHNPASPMGAGGAWNNALREKTRSRIWRVLPTDATPEPILNLSTATIPQLVSTLSNRNMHWRLQAQRLLIEKGWSAELGTLLEGVLTSHKAVDDVGNNPAVIHAVWTLQGLGRFETDAATWNPLLKALLKHPAEGVRRNVLRAMPRTTASAQAIGDQCSMNDPNAHVRLQALVALGEISNKPAGLPAISTAFQNTDSHSQSAFTASGITAAATAGCTMTLDPVGTDPVAVSAPAPQPRSDLRFAVGRDGFKLEPHGQLPDGELIVADARGRVIFTSTYSARDARWSRASAGGLKPQVYVYAFRGKDGSLLQGRLTLAAGI